MYINVLKLLLLLKSDARHDLSTHFVFVTVNVLRGEDDGGGKSLKKHSIFDLSIMINSQP